MTLRQAVERALQQNPEIAMARLDELKAQEAVRVQKDPFAPHVYFGSGLAYTNGFPMSIDGAAPSVVQGRVSESLFNRQQSYAVAQHSGRGPRSRHRGVRQERGCGLSHGGALLWTPSARRAPA